MRKKEACLVFLHLPLSCFFSFCFVRECVFFCFSTSVRLFSVFLSFPFVSFMFPLPLFRPFRVPSSSFSSFSSPLDPGPVFIFFHPLLPSCSSLPIHLPYLSVCSNPLYIWFLLPLLSMLFAFLNVCFTR